MFLCDSLVFPSLLCFFVFLSSMCCVNAVFVLVAFRHKTYKVRVRKKIMFWLSRFCWKVKCEQ